MMGPHRGKRLAPAAFYGEKEALPAALVTWLLEDADQPATPLTKADRQGSCEARFFVQVFEAGGGESACS